VDACAPTARRSVNSTIENVGGDVDLVTSRRCTFHAMPWFWPQGDACIVRFVAIVDTTGEYRIEKGN